ncbi:hypothetical protein KC19_9G069200 [Ceratodon purpureus]|uniref:RRM domain-containing protein n=1 Tax=Ceratodon purpureus TaxID=3225 RepID=A0A8T0GT02_CERPU|nr:hypothetical protein KC19_9G069200 [Ceratodon purpureus]
MGSMGEKRRDGGMKKEKKEKKDGHPGNPEKKKGEKAIEAPKAAAPVVLKLRLFVGGLGPTVGAGDLLQRFAPLGTVHKIDLVEGKKGWDPEDAAQRGFAYVDFEASSEASLRKLFSAYNGCKFKGGVLRVEKAKEHYVDRLRREWAEAEAEKAAKAKIAEKAAAMAVTQSRDMYSFTPDYEIGSESPERNRVELEQGDADGMAVDADEMAVDADVIAAQIEKERKGHLDLLSKLFPDDKDAGDEEEKIVEIVKLRAFPMPDANVKKRKHALENPSESIPVASSSAQPNEDESEVAVPKSPAHESDALDTNDRQKAKTRRVKFSEEADGRPIQSMNDEKVGMKTQHKGSSDATKDVRPILKKTQEDSKKKNVEKDENEDDVEEEEEEEEEYYLSSRSPSPEGGLSDESKWQRLFKYAGPNKGSELSKPSAGIYTGINLDDDDDEVPAVAETPRRDGVRSDGMFSGVLSEEDDEKTGSPLQSTLGSKAADSVVSKKMKKKIPVKTPQRDGVGSDGIFSGILSDPEEEEDQPQPSTLGQDSVALNSAKHVEEPELSSDAMPDQGEESSDFEDADEDLQDTESSDFEMGEEEDDEDDDEEDEEDDEEEDEDEDMDDFVDAASTLKSLTPTPLNDAARASKWAKMFKSATAVAEPVDGAFSGSLDEADVPVRARPAVKEQRMFESAAANKTRSSIEAPTASDKIVTSEVDEETARQSSEEEDAGTSSEEDVPKTENKDVTDVSGDDQEQTGTAGGNLLARFNMEQDEVSPSIVDQTNGAQVSEGLQQDGDGVGVSNSTPQPEGQNAVDENTKWIQRASWKSLMGSESRATFSLKQVTGESEPADVKKIEKPAVPEQRFGTFSFNFARDPSETSEATTSRVNPINTKRTEKAPNHVQEKSVKPPKVTDDEAGCSFMKSADADKEWRASKNELRIDSKAKHKAAVRKMKKMKGSGGAR